MKGTPEELSELLLPYDIEDSKDAIVVVLFEILKELKRLRMSK